VSLTLDVMMNKQRAARLNIQRTADQSQPDFETVLEALAQASWYEQRQTAVAGAIQRLTADQFLNRLMTLANDTGADAQVRSQAFLTIQNLDQWLARQSPLRTESNWTAFYARARYAIAAMMNDPSKASPVESPPAPPGSPIGN
jgi:hypothetical protein